MKYQIIRKYKSVEKTEYDEEHIEETWTGKCDVCGHTLKWTWEIRDNENNIVLSVGKCCMKKLLGFNSTKRMRQMEEDYYSRLDQIKNRTSIIIEEYEKVSNSSIRSLLRYSFNLNTVEEINGYISLYNYDIEVIETRVNDILNAIYKKQRENKLQEEYLKISTNYKF